MTAKDWWEALALGLAALVISWAYHRRQRRRFLQDKGAIELEALRRREVERSKARGDDGHGDDAA